MMSLGILGSAIAAAGLGTYSEEVLADDPEIYWRYTEAVGSSSGADSSGNGRGCTFVSGSYLRKTTLVAESGDYSCGSGTFPYRDYEAWMGSMSAWTLEGVFMLTSGSRNSGTAVSISGTGSTLGVYSYGGALEAASPIGGLAMGSIVIGTPYHVALTYDGTTLRGYVNGVEKSSRTGSLTIPSTNARLSAGGIWNGSGWAYSDSDQFFDELAVYSAALGAGRVLSHAQAGGFA